MNQVNASIREFIQKLIYFIFRIKLIILFFFLCINVQTKRKYYYKRVKLLKQVKKIKCNSRGGSNLMIWMF